jgi:hypothetical protein
VIVLIFFTILFAGLIQWINTVDGYFALGPSRVNPLTGEILGADILVDASFIRALRNNYR